MQSLTWFLRNKSQSLKFKARRNLLVYIWESRWKWLLYLCTLNLYCVVFSLICLQHSGHTFKPLDEVYDQHVSSITDEVLINLLYRWLCLSIVYSTYYGTIKVSDFCSIFNLFQFSSPRDSKVLYWLFVGCSFETKINGADKSCSGSGEFIAHSAFDN